MLRFGDYPLYAGAETSFVLAPLISSFQLIAGGMLTYLALVEMIGVDNKKTVVDQPPFTAV